MFQLTQDFECHTKIMKIRGSQIQSNYTLEQVGRNNM